MNAHTTLWYSYIDDHRGTLISNIINSSNHIALNTNTPTRVPNTMHQQAISPNITSISTSLYNTTWHTKHTLSSDHLLIFTTLNTHTKYTLQQQKHSYINSKKANWKQYTGDTVAAFYSPQHPQTHTTFQKAK